MAIYSEFSHLKLWFSIAMLNYQRVSDRHSFDICSKVLRSRDLKFVEASANLWTFEKPESPCCPGLTGQDIPSTPSNFLQWVVNPLGFPHYIRDIIELHRTGCHSSQGPKTTAKMDSRVVDYQRLSLTLDNGKFLDTVTFNPLWQTERPSVFSSERQFSHEEAKCEVKKENIGDCLTFLNFWILRYL